MPNMPSSARGASRNSSPIGTAKESPSSAEERGAAAARSGLSAPRFWPVTVDEAASSAVDVQVISEKSWV